MSGIEIAGLAIGVVPIIVEILRSYRATKDRLKTFAHHAHVIYDVQLRYRVAATNFSNDCQLLLKAVVDDARELSEMVENPKHRGWQAASLEERFRNFLARDYQLCEEIVVRIRDVLRETQARLAGLDRRLTGTGEPQQKTVQRLYQAFNIAIKENQYRSWLDDLDQWNSKLGRLRAQRCKLQKRRNYRADCLIRRSVPRQYSDIRAASQRLHESLRESWSCTNVSHTEHQAKLSLDAKAEYGTAQLDMVIACQRRALLGNQKPPSEAPIWLHVQSVTTNEQQTMPNTTLKPPGDVITPSTSLQAPTVPSKTVASRPIIHTVQRTLKRVRFNEVLDQQADLEHPHPKLFSPAKTSVDSHALSFTMLDLKATQSVCCHLSKACLSSSCKDTCLGYLETLEIPRSFKFVFYDAGRNTETGIIQKNTNREAYSIDRMLQSFEILHQLTLAHKLATAILQYHSTSWLPQDWNLQDIAFFTDTAQIPEEDITKKLQTLHLSTQFPPEQSAALADLDHSPEQLNYMYGIRNITLAKLGVALLEIGFKKDISSFSLDASPHRIIAARKLLIKELPSLAMLGKRYIKIARRCIDCDFSCGNDLSEDELQSAVYTDVVCVLEDMIGDWKRFLDIE